MKAILILDEMPDKCIECPFAVQEYGGIIWCKITSDDCEKANLKRNDNCPLKLINNEGNNNEN